MDEALMEAIILGILIALAASLGVYTMSSIDYKLRGIAQEEARQEALLIASTITEICSELRELPANNGWKNASTTIVFNKRLAIEVQPENMTVRVPSGGEYVITREAMESLTSKVMPRLQLKFYPATQRVSSSVLIIRVSVDLSGGTIYVSFAGG